MWPEALLVKIRSWGRSGCHLDNQKARTVTLQLERRPTSWHNVALNAQSSTLFKWASRGRGYHEEIFLRRLDPEDADCNVCRSYAIYARVKCETPCGTKSKTTRYVVLKGYCTLELQLVAIKKYDAWIIKELRNFERFNKLKKGKVTLSL